MGYRIRMVPEVAGWLGQLRDADPSTAAPTSRPKSGPGCRSSALSSPTCAISTPTCGPRKSG
jgi:hypothetical protein